MKVPSLRKIFSSDFRAEYKELMDQLGILFNGALEPLYNAVNNNLTFKDNFLATVIDINVAVADDGTPRNATSFKLANNQTTVSGIFVINASGGNNGNILPTGGIFVAFSQDGKSVTISNIKGLETNVTYKIKLVALG